MKKEAFEKSGIRGEERVKEVLEKLCPGKYIHDLLFRYYGVVENYCSTQIDFLCILDKFIYVIEVKNWNSITYYDQKNDVYYVPIVQNNRHTESPLKQNESHRKFLCDFFGIDPNSVVCLSVICTDDTSDKIFVRDRNPYHFSQSHVIRLDQLRKKIQYYENFECQRDATFEQIWSEIERANWPNKGIYKEQHDKYYNKCKLLYRRGKSYIFGFKLLRCDRCDDGHLVVREKEGKFFLGCSNYRSGVGCRKTDSLENAEKYADININDEERLIYYMSITEYEERKKSIKYEIQEKRNQLAKIEELLEEKKTKLTESEKLIETNKKLEGDGKVEQLSAMKKEVDNYRNRNYALLQKIELLEEKNKKLQLQNQDLELRYEDLEQRYDKVNHSYLNTFKGKIMSYLENRCN